MVGVVTLITAWLTVFLWLIILPVVVWQYNVNRKTIDMLASYSVIMNAACQWKLVARGDGQVIDAHMGDFWITPIFMAFSLSSVLGKHHYIVLKYKVDAATFSRLNVGIQNND